MTVLERAVVVQQVAHLPSQAGGGGSSPTPRLHFAPTTVQEVNHLLEREHYLGPIKSGRVILGGYVGDVLVACQVYRHPTSRHLPSDGSFLELSRWCLTPDAGENAGSRMQGWASRHLRKIDADLTTLVSYSDPAVGHLGTLYRASGWVWRPAWQRLRPPPSLGGSWNGRDQASIKDRWALPLRPDPMWSDPCGPLAVKDDPALRRYLTSAEWRGQTWRWANGFAYEMTLPRRLVPKS